MSLTNVLVAIVIIAFITMVTRYFPFLFFSAKQPPEVLLFIGKYIPPVIITILVLYCLKDIQWGGIPHGLNEVLAVMAVLLLHSWKRNPLLSIFGPTVLYMILLQTGAMEKVFFS
ncbi:putative membrane protein [Propionispora sp. 2/2-37]|uniref:branched-chain amino acid transporter permease n=1 Tax=Propionispora sp. 2/2-37 TaxID=1677858 RepID=UPI0006BB87E5|nr:AzlD domain-containing protein [Propionispora sp. 2/2-37]CUH96729.1 putative membrane protein [Propionispora sp. 2/2-37]